MSLLVNGVGVEVRGSIGAGSLLDAVERALHAAAGARPDSTVATKTYSVGDMVRLLKMRSKKALYAAVKRKQIPGVVRQGRRKLLFNSATIDAWLNKGGGRS